MSNYLQFMQQRFDDFPNEEFKIENNELIFNDLPIMDLINQFGTPFRMTYLPKITEKIQQARQWFQQAMEKQNYDAEYMYCYCTKSSHFEFILSEVLKNNAHLETSSAFDVNIIESLYQKGKLTKDTYVIANGFKRTTYTQNLTRLLNNGFINCIPVLDNLNEIDNYDDVEVNFKVGIRIATDEEPQFNFWTSRLGVRYNDVMHLYENKIATDDRISLKLLHFFINTGIKDSAYYWNELNKFVIKYCELKRVCPTLDTIDIGGGFPFKSTLDFNYDYEGMIEVIIQTIQNACNKYNVPVPNIITEFGSYTVSESGATIFSILDTKLQNDKELWYMIDGSFINNLPDTWAIGQHFIMLAINNWNQSYTRVHLGGLTCDSMDYYHSEDNNVQIFLPEIPKNSTQYIGFFHTGAYQEVLGGFGGLQHCLVPSPKHIVIDKDEEGNILAQEFCPEQKPEQILQILGH